MCVTGHWLEVGLCVLIGVHYQLDWSSKINNRKVILLQSFFYDWNYKKN